MDPQNIPKRKTRRAALLQLDARRAGAESSPLLPTAESEGKSMNDSCRANYALHHVAQPCADTLLDRQRMCRVFWEGNKTPYGALHLG